MEIITGIVVPLVLGLLAAFGATWYSNRQSARRTQREADDRAADAVRAYIRALSATADHLEAKAMAYEGWDPSDDVINHGGPDAVRTAYNAAEPYFHRLQVRDEDGNPLRNEYPTYGNHPMDGAENFATRAKQIQAILDRGLRG